jgi:putative DNA-invertase from lambdoid prophage Rac
MTCLSSPKTDRLGHNAMDVTTTVDRLAQLGVHVYCRALRGADLASAASRIPMQVINAVAQLERDLLIERTSSGLARAEASGDQLGRPKVLDDKRAAGAHAALKSGETVSAVAKKFDTSRQTIMRARDAVVEAWSSKEPRGCVMDDGGVG